MHLVYAILSVCETFYLYDSRYYSEMIHCSTSVDIFIVLKGVPQCLILQSALIGRVVTAFLSGFFM